MMNLIWWYLSARRTFIYAVKKYGDGDDILTACYKNNVCGCRSSYHILYDMANIVAKNKPSK